MATATVTAPPAKRQARPKPPRLARLLIGPDPDGTPGLLKLRVGSKADVYWLKPIPAEGGRGFELRKLRQPETYHVLIADGGGRSCDCKGHSRWKHCKHSDGLAVLLAAGRLPAPPGT